MKEKKEKGRKKEPGFVCSICGKKEKPGKGKACCGKEMLKKEGVWPD